MFELDDNWFGICMGLLLSKKFIREFPREKLNSVADTYCILSPEKVKNKIQLIVLILEAWYSHFEKNPDFFEEYKKKQEIEITIEELKHFLQEV